MARGGAGSPNPGRERNYLADEEKKRKDFRVSGPPITNSSGPRLGALASMRPSAMGAQVEGEFPSAPQGSIGAAAQPRAIGNEPPPVDEQEFAQRVTRNESFLNAPETKAALLQFGISMMATAGRGNIGSNIGRSLGHGLQAAGRVQTNAAEGDLAERKMRVDEGALSLAEKKLASEMGELGQREYSRYVSGASAIGAELGIPSGENALVQFKEDQYGNIINYSVSGQPFGGDDFGESIPELHAQADAAEASGDIVMANQLRQQAEMKATGAEFVGTVDAGKEIIINEKGERELRTIPNSKAAGEEAAAAEKELVGDVQEISTGLNVKRATDKAIEQITSSKFPDLTLTGIGSYLEHVRGTEAHDLARNIDTIRANLGFIKLQDIRDASQTGAALGPVSDFENRLMQATVTNIMNTQSSGQLLENLRYIQIMFDDAQYEGRLTEIGNMVDRGEINIAMGVQEANDYIESVVRGETEIDKKIEKTLSTEEDKEAESDEAPSDAPAEVKEVWPYWTLDQRKRALSKRSLGTPDTQQLVPADEEE